MKNDRINTGAVAVLKLLGATELELLQDIGNRIISLQDVDDVLQQIVSGAIELTNTNTGVIYLISEDGQSVTDSFYPPGFEHPRPRLEMKEGLTRQVIETGKTLRILDIHQDPRVNPVFLDHFQSMIAVPLKIEQKVIGVLYLNDADLHDFTETEISLLSTLASQAAIAIHNARLYETLEEKVEQRTRQLRREHERRLAAEAWATLGKAAGNLMHRINNTTGIIPFAVQSLRELLEDVPVDGERRRDVTGDLDRIERNSKYTLQLARALWKPFEALPTKHQDVNELLEEAISVADIPPNVHLQRQFDGNLPTTLTSHLLTDVFVELITNAVKAMPDGGRLTIESKKAKNEHVEVRFLDTGRGISSEDQEKIFNLFFTTDESSLGFGLWWAKTFLTSQGGAISVKSGEGRGAIFAVRLPIEGPRALVE